MTACRSLARLVPVVALLGLVLDPCNAAGQKLKVVTSTTLLQSAAREVGGAHVDVSVLIAPGSCPGHYDIRPQDVRTLSSSKLVLVHGYETFIDKLVSSIGRNKPILVRIRTSGSWTIPDIYLRGAKEVADALCSVDRRHSAYYRESLSKVQARIEDVAAQARNNLRRAGAFGVAVLCSDQQKQFAQWLGLKVVGTYARPEEFTPAGLHKLTALGRKHKVRLVIDNLQSGPVAGKQLARDLRAAHVTLSNFPGGYAGTTTWSGFLRDNLRRILKALDT